LLPDAMVSEDLQAGRLVRVLNGYEAEQVTVRAVYPSRRQLALKVRTFLDFAAIAFGRSQNELRTASVSSIGKGVTARDDGRQNAKQIPECSNDRRFGYLAATSPSVVVNMVAARTHKCFGSVSAALAPQL